MSIKFLITRCTTYDMAGVAMINGAIAGLTRIYPDAEFAAVMVNEDDIAYHPKLVEQYSNDDSIRMIVEWADCLIDLGGLCKGYDPYRHEYIEECRKQDKPYIYMAVSFEHPDPRIVKDVPATARGPHSAAQYAVGTSGVIPQIVPDISFLIEPEPVAAGDFIAFTTHKGKPWPSFMKIRDEAMVLGVNIMQVIFKPPRNGIEYEPSLEIQEITGNPETLYGMIGASEKLMTCRYHAAVAAIMAGVKYEIPLGMPNVGKYKDLEIWKGKDLESIRKEAFRSCELVKEVLHG